VADDYQPLFILFFSCKRGYQVSDEPAHDQPVKRHGVPVGFDRTASRRTSYKFPIQKPQATTQKEEDQADSFFIDPIAHSNFFTKIIKHADN
jgi:hypothetical protein